MAKAVTATKGGVSVTGGFLDITGVRLVYYYDPVIDPNVPIKRWICEWKLFESITEAKKPFVTGRPMDQGEIVMDYVKNKDPVEESYKLLSAEFAKKWTVTSTVELP